MKDVLIIASSTTWNLDGIVRLITRIGGILFDLAPALVFASYVVCALVWVFSGGNQKMVKWARDQMLATTLVFFVLVSYFTIKEVILTLVDGKGF